MKYKIEILEELDADIVIYAKESSPVLEKIEAMLGELDTTVFGYNERGMIKLSEENVYCFFVESGKVYAQTASGKLLIKDRLYRLESIFRGFVKINQSCLVNLSKIKRFDTSVGGALTVVLENGYRDYISRRQVKEVKERIGF